MKTLMPFFIYSASRLGIKLAVLAFLFLGLAGSSFAAIEVQYKDHSFDSSGNLTVNIKVNLADGGCLNPISGGWCQYTFAGNIHLMQGSTSVVSDTFHITRIVGHLGSGTNTTESIIFPSASLGGLTIGNQYDIVIELGKALIPQQPFKAFYVFSPCFDGTVDNSTWVEFPNSSSPGPCEIVVDCFTYGPAVNSFTWQQNQGLMCTYPPLKCWTVNTLTGSFSGPAVSPSVIYTWFVDGVQVSTNQNMSYTFPNCGTYEVELQIGQSGSTCPIVITEAITIEDSPMCSVGPKDPPCCGTERTGVFTENEIPVYLSPNPVKFNGSVLIEYFQAKTGSAKISIYDTSGRMLKSELASERETGTHTHKLGLPKLSRGIYLIQIESGTAIAHVKLMIE